MNETIIKINGELYEVHSLESPERQFEYLGHCADRAVQKDATAGMRHRLTPLPDTDKRVVQYKLGVAMWESVPKKLRPRIDRWDTTENGDDYWDNVDRHTHRAVRDSSSHWIILRPPKAEKTDREMLEETVAAMVGVVEKTNFQAIINSIREHLNSE